MNTSLFIALRYWRAKSGDRFGRLVSSLASLGIVLGVMALVIVLSVMNGLENHQKRNVLSGLPHAIVSPNTGYWQTSADFQPLAPAALVQKSVPINRAHVIIQSQQGIYAGQLIGVSQAEDDPLLDPTMDIASSLPEGEYQVAVSSELAKKQQWQIGDKLRLMITENSQYTPFGRVPVQRLFTISAFYPPGNQDSEYTLFANLSDVGRLLRIEQGQAQGVRLFLNDPFDVSKLAQFFPEAQWQISDWREQKGEFFQAVRMEKNMMGLLVSLIIVVAISNIVTSLSLMVIDKQGEIAILQTQGLNKGAVMQIFIAQGGLVGVIGALLGGVLGGVISLYLGELLYLILPYAAFLPTEIDVVQIAMIISGSALLSLLCTLYPAYRAAKIEPAEALRYE